VSHGRTARAAPGAAVLATAALVLAACGEDREAGTGTGGTGTGTGTTGEATGPAVARVEVEETEYRLNPANPRIDEAGTIDFAIRNAGQVEHALEVETQSGEVETENIAPGGTATLKADLEPGAYVWYCPVGDHRERGMEGRITVAGGRRGGAGTDTGTDTGTTEEDTGEGGGGGGGGY
jgi:plastocyanin